MHRRAFSSAWSALLLAAAAAPPCRSQEAFRPGDSTLRVARVPLGVDTLVVLVTPPGGGERLHATLVRRVERLRVHGEELLRESQDGYDDDGILMECDTLEVSATTLDFRRVVEHAAAPIAPLSQQVARQVARQDTEPVATPARALRRLNELRAEWGRLRGYVTHGRAGAQAVDVPATPFFHDMALEAFIAAWPIAPARAVRVPLMHPPKLAVREVDFVPLGTAVLRTAAGPVPCVAVRGPGGSTLWLAEDDGRLVRMRWMLPSGATVWKLPRRDVEYR